MTRTENPIVVEAVMVLRHVGKGPREISSVLKERNMTLSPSGVSLLIRRNSGKSNKQVKRTKRRTNPGSPKIRTKILIGKVKKDLKRPNPLTQKEVFVKHKISKGTLWNVINKDLQGVLRKKYEFMPCRMLRSPNDWSVAAVPEIP